MNGTSPQQALAEYKARVQETADRVAEALHGERNPIVVLDALMCLHRFTCKQLPPKTQGDVGFSVAAYAGDLMQASATGIGIDSFPPVL